MKTAKQIVNNALNRMGQGKYKTKAARRLLLAIGFQESAFKHRKQFKGPARSFWQFEVIGILEVLINPATKQKAAKLIEAFGFNPETANKRLLAYRIHDAFEKADYDPLAGAFARLLLWRDPEALPDTKKEAWDYYLRNWRPGKPHPNRWEENWNKALEAMGELEQEKELQS